MHLDMTGNGFLIFTCALVLWAFSVLLTRNAPIPAK